MVVNFHCCPLKIQQIRAKQTMSDCYMSKKICGLVNWIYLTTSERLHIYRKICSFLERWRIFLPHEQAKL